MSRRAQDELPAGCAAVFFTAWLAWVIFVVYVAIHFVGKFW